MRGRRKKLDEWEEHMDSRDGQMDGTAGWPDQMGVWDEPGRWEKMRKSTVMNFFPLFIFFCLLNSVPSIFSNLISCEISHSLLRDSTPLIIFNFSDYYLLFFEPHPWVCSRGGECNGYEYPFLYIFPIQPHPI